MAKSPLSPKIAQGLRSLNSPDKKRIQLRDQLWPGSSQWIWDFSDKEKVKGFATVPRLLPWVMHLIKHLSTGGDPSSAYLELWCRDFGQSIIEITDEQECAYAAGYASTRAVRTWREHMLKLVEMGFIRVQPSGNREYGQVLLLHPLAVCRRLHEEGKTPEGWWPAFVARATAISAEVPPVLDFPKKDAKQADEEED